MRQVIVHMDDPRRGRTGIGAPNEDTTGGFEPAAGTCATSTTPRKWVVDSYAAAGGFLLGAAPSRAWRCGGARSLPGL
jgi:hypothetical protein